MKSGNRGLENPNLLWIEYGLLYYGEDNLYFDLLPRFFPYWIRPLFLLFRRLLWLKIVKVFPMDNNNSGNIHMPSFLF